MANPINCASCGKKLTAKAITCPKCRTPVSSATDNPLASTKPDKKGTLWAYVTGTLFIITGLGAFQISLLSALMLILGGVFALPFVRAGLVKLTGFSNDKFLIIASAVLIIVGTIGYTSSVKSDRLASVESDSNNSE